MERMKKSTKEKTKRIEIHSGPDSLGRYHYTLFWIADYHPGDPRGEHRTAERGQCFHAPLPADVPANWSE